MGKKLAIIFSIVSFIACIPVKNDSPREFKSPLKSYDLPKELEEASGLAFYSTKELILINDEEGILYFFDLEKEKVNRTVEFKEEGDFEGVTVVKDVVFVLESNGTINKISSNGKMTSSQPFDDGFNLEGLTYHQKRHSLLIACKEHSKKKKDDHIWVFEYNLAKEVLEEEPYLKIDKSKPLNNFRPSGIAFNSKGNLIITSAVNESIVEIDKDAKVVNKISLPKKKYPQVEGIAFDHLGHLFLASEKAGRDYATLYKIKF